VYNEIINWKKGENKMTISIDRLAMQIAGKSTIQASRTLDRFGFSLAEASEIVSAHWRSATNSVDPDFKAVAVTVKSVIGTSIRIGDRIDFSIG
jgi:hypothetical protein